MLGAMSSSFAQDVPVLHYQGTPYALIANDTLTSRVISYAEGVEYGSSVVTGTVSYQTGGEDANGEDADEVIVRYDAPSAIEEDYFISFDLFSYSPGFNGPGGRPVALSENQRPRYRDEGSSTVAYNLVVNERYTAVVHGFPVNGIGPIISFYHNFTYTRNNEL